MHTLTHSDRKFIRSEKASIRAKFSDAKKQEEMITELYKKFTAQPEAKEAVKVDKVGEPKVAKKAEKAPKVKKDKPKSK
ncbi:hypothetical protein KW786_00395 [Candidatus Parcubacteria bacterium]|nr:hypothetical protein [Candidatus Parcubacteria bacterium]